MEIDSAVAVLKSMNRLDAIDNGHGREGRRLRSAVSNFWGLSLAPRDLHVYGVDIKEVDKPRPEKRLPETLTRQVVKDMFAQNRGNLNTGLYCFDGATTLITVASLVLDSDGADLAEEVELSADSTAPGRDREAKFIVTLRPASVRNPHELLTYIQNRRGEVPADVIQALDIIAKDVKVRKGCITTARSIFDPKTSNAAEIFGGFHIWRGWYQSIRPSLEGAVINVDLAFSAFLPQQSGLQFASKILGRTDLRGGLNTADVNKLSKEMKNFRFVSTHSDVKRTYVINKVQGVADRISIEMDGRNITIADYFLQRYKKRINYPQLPLAVVKTGRGFSHFPLEYIEMEGNQRRKSLVTPRQAQEVIRIAAVRPQPRLNQLREITRNLGLQNDELARQVLAVGDQVKVPGARVLQPPVVGYGQNRTVQPRDGGWNIKSMPLVAAPDPVRSYGVLNLTRMPSDAIASFFRRLMEIGRGSGYQMAPLQSQLISHAAYTGSQSQLEHAFTRLHGAVLQRFKACQVIFVIIDKKAPDPYQKIKVVGDTVVGVVTQCLTAKTVQKMDPTTLANVVLKLNGKVGSGGKNHIAHLPSNPNLVNAFEKRPFMILGADVTHPGPGSEAKSIAGLCASIDRNMSRYVGDVRVQLEVRQEPILTISEMLPRLLGFFRNSQRNMLPETIIMFRDGVAENQQDAVLGQELTEIRKGCRALDPTYNPKLSYIIVNKRHHTRFFVQDRTEGDRNSNPLPGTTVDTNVCNPEFYEFYQYGAFALQGSAKPTLYRVLYDECRFTPDQLQNLTFRLAHSYSRCTRSVSLVTPVYYAHHLASRGRCYAGGDEDSGSDPSTRGTGSSLSIPTVHQNIRASSFWI